MPGNPGALPLQNEAAAYPDEPAVRIRRGLVYLAISFTIYVMGRNILFKDYKADTIEYLKSTGNADAIERVVPKSASEKRGDARTAAASALLSHIDDLTKSVKALQTEVLYLQWTVGNLTGVPVPRGPPPLADNSTVADGGGGGGGGAAPP